MVEILGAVKGAVNGNIGSLLKMVAPQVLETVDDLTKGQNMLQELVNAPIQAMIKQVTGGIWKGEGADRFVSELNSSFLPNVQGISEHIGGMAMQISSAVDTIQQTDQKSAGLVSELTADFEKI